MTLDDRARRLAGIVADHYGGRCAPGLAPVFAAELSAGRDEGLAEAAAALDALAAVEEMRDGAEHANTALVLRLGADRLRHGGR